MAVRTPPPIDATTFRHVREKFEARARALLFARLALMAIGLCVLVVPAWRRLLDLELPEAPVAFLALLACHVGSYLGVTRSWGRALTFATLCVDLVVLVYLIAASGGLGGPLMPVQLVFTMLFAFLNPRPLGILPPLLVLPVVVRIDQILGTQVASADLLLLLWYSALNLVVVQVVVYLDRREESGFADVLRLQRQRRRAELAAERAQLAREIHDGLGAAISGLKLQAEYLERSVSDEDLRRELGDLRAASEEGLDELRRAVAMMRADFELVPAMEDWALQFCARRRVPLTFEGADLQAALDAEAQLCAFRVLQESLNNAARHADARAVEVRASVAGATFTLRVRDDGRGFDPAAVPAGHYGLRHMRERAARVGGRIAVASAPGRGTTVELRLPCRPEPA